MGRTVRRRKGRKNATAKRRSEKHMRRNSGSKAVNPAEQELVMEGIGEEDAEELDDTSKKQICF